MRFRPCIDLHKGAVKQIVGSTYGDDDAKIETNFVADKPSEWFAGLYRTDGLTGGHVIMLGPGNTDAALAAVRAFPGGMQVGGGITPETAPAFLDAGASHVIMTSYVFSHGTVDRSRLQLAARTIGKNRLVLDLSCKRNGDSHFIVTDRWRTSTDVAITGPVLAGLAAFCDEFLVHAADVEGKQQGIDEELTAILGAHSPIPVTYAGGIRSIDDLEAVRRAGIGRVDATVGSALDIFGGTLAYAEVVAWNRKEQTHEKEREDRKENR